MGNKEPLRVSQLDAGKHYFFWRRKTSKSERTEYLLTFEMKGDKIVSQRWGWQFVDAFTTDNLHLSLFLPAALKEYKDNKGNHIQAGQISFSIHPGD